MDSNKFVGLWHS